ncbi:LutC/YkgG family protein [Paraburkholderia heleia]|uniref:LutC/YkgG family protein n=1 Tax=Paraburkholderia heleia TaxID=634127 RepID=UPI0005A6F170|nr:lactate utilization protein C [Paraburkholderia heleia]
MSARARMLQRLRGHAPAAPSTTLEALDARIDAHFAGRRAPGPLALNERIAQFQRMLEAAQAEVICASAATWAADLAGRLAAAGVRNLLLDSTCAEGQALEAALPAAVQARGYTRPIEEWKAELFDTIDAGFTVARSGLAATGTLVVVPDANAPRTVSLVPPLHVALIHASTLHADLHAAVAAERWRDGMPTNLVMISGPSKTSDIQQTTAYGAHGPRALWVVVVTDEDRETGVQQGAAE